MISLGFLEKILKLGVPISEILRCHYRFSFSLGEPMNETTKHALLHFGVQDKVFVMNYMCHYADHAKRFNWTEDDDIDSFNLGYSDAFRVHMKELHDEVPQDFIFKIIRYFQ